MKALIFFLLLATSLTAHAQSANEVASRASLFRYNAGPRVTVKEVSSEQRSQVRNAINAASFFSRTDPLAWLAFNNCFFDFLTTAKR